MEIPLTKGRAHILSEFDLFGASENEITAAFALALRTSSKLRGAFLDVIERGGRIVEEMRLEAVHGESRTDLELNLGGETIILEAKKGWRVPTHEQLGKYAELVMSQPVGKLVTISDASEEWAEKLLPASIGDVAVQHVSWRTILNLVDAAVNDEDRSTRELLRKFDRYVRKVAEMRNGTDMWTYCVSLSDKKFGDITFMDYVTGEGVYFHPHSDWQKGWPTNWPNFLAFRWKGHTRQVNRVLSVSVVDDLREFWPTIPEDVGARSHVLYKLGPAIPMRPLPNGGAYASGRVWVLLDQLLTATNLLEAVERSKELAGQ
jgi:hypothetical protein